MRYLDGCEGRPRVTFSAMIESLAAGVHILYLVCHRTIANGEAWLWFEDDTGGCIPIAERVVAERIAALRQLLPPFFRALSRHGQIDHALAIARAAVNLEQPWWMPVLWLRMRDGSLWATDNTVVPPARYTIPAAHYLVPTEARAGW